MCFSLLSVEALAEAVLSALKCFSYAIQEGETMQNSQHNTTGITRHIQGKHIAAVLGLVLMSASAPMMAPRIAFADTSAQLQAQLDDAKAHLNEIQAKLMAAGEELNDTQYQLEQTKAKITEMQKKIDTTKTSIKENTEKLDKRRAVLANRVSANYKMGGTSLLSIVLDADSLESLISNIYYADKVAAADKSQIDEISDLQSELETQEAELQKQQDALKEQESSQQKLVDQKQAQQDELASQQADQKAYIDSLSAEVQKALKAEAEAERKRQAEAAAEAERQAQAAIDAQQRQHEGNNTQNPGNNNNGNSNNTNNGGSSNKHFDGTTRSIIVQAAYSCIGTPYVLGAYSPGTAIDCSGLTKWAYAQAGLSIPHSSAAQRNMTNIKPISQCHPGDMVFWYGHVAIYVGNGKIVHANYGGVEETTLYGSYLGGGCPFDI